MMARRSLTHIITKNKRIDIHENTVPSFHCFPVDLPLESIDGNSANGGNP